MKLNAVRIASPGGVRLAAHLGQTKSLLAVTVTIDGGPAAGVPVEVLFADGSSAEGLTDPSSGMFQAEYGPSQYGPAVVRITPPPGVEDLGEDTAQGAELTKDPANLSFVMTSSPSGGNGKTKELLTVAATLGVLMVAGLS
jgi:hypothetical protein